MCMEIRSLGVFLMSLLHSNVWGIETRDSFVLHGVVPAKQGV